MRLAALLLVVLLSAGCLQGFGEKVGLAPARPDPYEMPALAEAAIRPGVAIGDPGFCTANFLFLDADGGTVYVGTAAHCVSDFEDPEDLTSSTVTDGCDTRNIPWEPETVQVKIGGASRYAVLAYNSWYTMQRQGEDSPTVCAANDFALLRLHPEDAKRAHPRILGGDGPTRLANDVAPGDRIYSYGASTLLGRPEDLSPREGIVLQSQTWTHTAYFLTPGVPGDSGSGVVRDDGAAVGILVTIEGLPPGANGLTDLARAIDYAQQHTDLRFRLLTTG